MAEAELIGFPTSAPGATVSAMQTRWAAILALLWLATTACRAGERGSVADVPATAGSNAPSAPASSKAPPAGASSDAQAAATREGETRLPFDYPTVELKAKTGDVILAPPRQWIENAIEHGVNEQPFAFFRAELVEVGRGSSLVRTPSGRQEEIPNALLIPIRRGERVKPGQIVLTSWYSGTGLQRAMTVEGGSPESPQVHYLDLKYKHPSGIGRDTERLPPNTFHRLLVPGEAGTSVACRDGQRHRHYVVVHVAGNQMIGLGFAGRLTVLDRSSCILLPIAPHIDDTPLFVPVMGIFQKARVRHYEEKLGRVFVRYSANGEDQDDVLGIVNVARKL